MDFGFSNFFIKKKPKQPKYIIPGSQSQIPSCLHEEVFDLETRQPIERSDLRSKTADFDWL